MKAIKDRVLRRKLRVSANIWGTNERPRIAVFRSNMYLYAQAIDDEARTTLASSSTLKKDKGAKLKKSEAAKEAGKVLGKILLDKNIKSGVFDRNRYAYNGRVKMLAEGLREAGLKI